jgi:hypothetical protein
MVLGRQDGECRPKLVLSRARFEVDQFLQECFSRQEAMGALPELVKITSPRQAPVAASSSKEDKR